MMKLLAFPDQDLSDIPSRLRKLAQDIEAGEYGAAHNLAWAIDCGDGRIEIGLLGKAPEPGVTAYYIFGLAMRKLEVMK